MRVLLVKPRPDALQFGLAPFFQTAPLGLEFIASALVDRGHTVTVVDMRFDWNHYDLHHLLRTPRLPGRRFFELYCETWR